jgi:pyruvate/2-oxoglutarate dehydrogenase complex dihydrolipoamide dehydrogenase (E3) component
MQESPSTQPKHTMQFDFVVIGGGSAGYAAARTAADLGKKVAVVDGAKELGGLCILRGCMPSKTLIYSAEALHLAQSGEIFGFTADNAKADLAAMQRRKQKVIAEFAEYRQGQLESDRFTLFRQKARFRDETSIELDDGSVLEAEAFLVATGSETTSPAVPGLNGTPHWTSDDILELDELPSSVITLGGGVVACELAQFLARVGTKVTLIQRSPHILKEFSEDASLCVEQAFRDEDIEVFTDTVLEEVEEVDDGAVVRFRHGGEVVERKAAHLFNALGRKPATKDLGLDAAKVELLQSGHLKTDAFQQTTNPRVYAAGDCAGPHEIVHVAIRQGEIAAFHAFGQSANPLGYDALLKVVFTDPQVAFVGLTEAELKKRGVAYLTASYPFDDHGKSILMNAIRGHVKVIAEKPSGRVLGAECVGKDAGELIQALSLAVSLQADVHSLVKADWYHPTLSEIWTYPLEDLAEALAEKA